MGEKKRCSKCKHIKPIAEFNQNKSRKDGLQTSCKLCQKINQKAYRRTKNGKAAHLRGDRKYNEQYPLKIGAHHAITWLLKAGRLPRPDTLLCYYCPNPAQQYHHWHGYEPEHWLDVIPVCQKCHKKVNKKIT